MISNISDGIMTYEEFGKVGSKGELYMSSNLRKLINLRPNMRVKYRVSPKGYIIVEPVYPIEDLLKMPPIAEVSVEEIESLSEKMQEKGSSDEN